MDYWARQNDRWYSITEPVEYSCSSCSIIKLLLKVTTHKEPPHFTCKADSQVGEELLEASSAVGDVLFLEPIHGKEFPDKLPKKLRIRWINIFTCRPVRTAYSSRRDSCRCKSPAEDDILSRVWVWISPFHENSNWIVRFCPKSGLHFPLLPHNEDLRVTY